MTAHEPLTHSVDIDLVGVTKLKSVTPAPSDQGVINGETTILRFRVRDGERITLDTGRRRLEVVVNPRAGAPYPGLGTADAPVVARDEAAELRAALREWREAREAEATAHEAWTNALAAQPPLTEQIDEWQAAKARLDDAVTALRRLATSEGSESC